MKKFLTFGVNTIKGAMKQHASKHIFVKIGGFGEKLDETQMQLTLETV